MAAVDPVILELVADADGFRMELLNAERVSSRAMDGIEKSASKAERGVGEASKRMGRSFDQAAYRSRLLGYQISDIGTQLASGQSPFLVLAQQGPQVANALEGVGGAAGRLAAFFSGPWGAALLAATTIAGGLVARLWDTEEAADAATASAQRLSQAISNLQSLNFSNEDIFTVLREAERLRVEAARLEARASQGRGAPGASGRFFEQERERLLQEARQLRLQADASLQQRRVFGELRSTIQRAWDLATSQGQSQRGGGGAGGAAAANRTLRDALRAAEQAERAAAALDERFEKTQAQLELERQLAELRDRGTDEARKQADILEAHFRIEQQFPQLAESVNQADRDRLQVLKDIASATIEEAYGRKAAREELERWFEAAEKRQRETQQARDKAEREAHNMQEQRIRTLGQLYYDAFSGGTRAIWDDFKHIGLAVIADVLARFTAARVGGDSFNLGDALGAAIGAVLPGFANGGSMMIGGRGGTDNNVLSLNGHPFARVSRGERLDIVPNKRLGGGPAPVIVSAPQFDLRGAVVTPKLYADMERISKAHAAEAAARAYGQAMKDAPGAMMAHQRYSQR